MKVYNNDCDNVPNSLAAAEQYYIVVIDFVFKSRNDKSNIKQQNRVLSK